MKRSVIAAFAIGTAAALAATVAAAAPSAARSTTKTFTFDAVSTVSHQFDKTHFIGADKDKQNGKLIGTDSVSCVATSTGKAANCTVAAAYKGGILYAKFTQQFSNGALSGTVTGGTRQYAGATGTVSGTSTSKTTEKVTITYHT